MSIFPVAQNYFRPLFINQDILELENAILMSELWAYGTGNFQYFSAANTHDGERF